MLRLGNFSNRKPRPIESPHHKRENSTPRPEIAGLEKPTDHLPPEVTYPWWTRIFGGLALGVFLSGSPFALVSSWVSRISQTVRDAETQQFLDEAEAACPADATAHEKSEFLKAAEEAFEKARELSADLAKDFAKDVVKGTLAALVLERVAPPVVTILRKWPNPITSLMADRIEKLIAKEAGSELPKGPLTEVTVIAVTDGTTAEARLTLQLIGYRFKGGIWLPLGIDESSKSEH